MVDKHQDPQKQAEEGMRQETGKDPFHRHRHPYKKKILDKKETKKKTYVSLIIKYFMFFSNFLFLVSIFVRIFDKTL